MNANRMQFESCVVLDGDKTTCFSSLRVNLFESCVVLDGDKTARRRDRADCGLRVVLF